MNTLKCSRLSTTYPLRPASYTRLLHAAPDTPPVDVVVNGNLIVKKLAYKQLAGYFTVLPCMNDIEIYPAGKHGECPIAEACLEICPKSAMTIALTGGCDGLLGIEEVFDPCRRLRDRCKAYVRFVNLSPNSPPLDVAYAGGTNLFQNVAYTARTRYVPVDPGSYVLRLRPAGTNQPGIAMKPVTLERGTTSTLYAVGFAGGTPPLDLVVSSDGNY